MRHSHRLIALALFGTTALSGPAFAQSTGATATQAVNTGAETRVDEVWQQLAEGGAVAMEDLRDHAWAAYSALDDDQDNMVSKTAFLEEPLPSSIGPKGKSPQLRQELFAKIDADGDNQISRSEWETALEKNVTMADVDEDGKVTLEELAQADAGTVIANFFQ